MIPVVILPTIVRRPDLLSRALGSIDHPVDRLVIVDNSLTGYQIDQDGPWRSVEYIRPILGLGNHGGINAGISQTPQAPWWLWINDDIQFGPGDLSEIVDMVESSDEPCVVTGDRKDTRYLMFCYGAINRAAFDKIGLVDEWTFYPIYYGDNDYLYRARLAGVEWIEFNGSISHGDDGMTASATIRSSPEMSLANQRTVFENERRYAEKWGGPPDRERYSTPWNQPVPLDWTRMDIEGRARRMW
jgi:GT2 family glycosyltransferase